MILPARRFPIWIWEWAFLVILLLIPQSSQAQDNATPDSNDPLTQNSTSTSHSGSENDSDDSKFKYPIIILSVIVGVVVIISVVSSIFYLTTKRGQWNVREALRRSTSHVSDAMNPPSTAQYTRSPRNFHYPRRNRSLRGMIKLQTSHTAEPAPAHINGPSRRFDEAHHPHMVGWGQREPRRGNEEFDLERGIELASTDHMKVTVSTIDSSIRSGSSSSKGGRGGFFGFGRRG
ncbi:hypothetical protein BGW36DRAFT_366474 [Talaromyces proteolyticus]|uniref:Transmembrane protein n=1 Tax=Talaromyces proteolyticus TaxID=1131652 RepID=A0AAD4Q3D2_9EURO|nr:uncharacterized protein BGW36DRAFT_366474 [Talaromyces proteolyticus]KAH8704934.1 hypothetical protein BGW36DRAFT_366474 [Talaromyces proteolyticus]